MEGYLGEIEINIEDSPFSNYTKEDWILEFIKRGAWIDGSHHKNECFDELIKIIKGVEIKVKLAKWGNGHKEWRLSLGKNTCLYNSYVSEWREGEEGPNTYSYLTD